MIFDLQGNPVAGHYCDYGADYPRPGWVEQDPDHLIAKAMEACRAAIEQSGLDPQRIASIGFSAQRSVACPVTGDGRPVRPMFSWQDARTAAEVEELRQIISDEQFYTECGLPLGTTWIITKLLWMRTHEPELLEKTARIVQNQDLVLKAFGAADFFGIFARPIGIDRCWIV
jgi:xylulokinase